MGVVVAVCGDVGKGSGPASEVRHIRLVGAWRCLLPGDDCERSPRSASDTVWKVPGEPAGDSRRQSRQEDLVESQLGQDGLDGFHRVRVARGAISCGADLAESFQLGVEVGLRLGNAPARGCGRRRRCGRLFQGRYPRLYPSTCIQGAHWLTSRSVSATGERRLSAPGRLPVTRTVV